jgi:TATA-box binding protein (TBP) (component of TFIID and TFIIIB)
MINYSTKFISSALISRETLHNSVRALNHEHIHSSYNPDVYPGVIIKIGPQKWCAKIFRTGKINLTGMTEHSECYAFIEALLQLLNEAIPTKPLKL